MEGVAPALKPEWLDVAAETFETEFAVGADGILSTVRKALGIEMVERMRSSVGALGYDAAHDTFVDRLQAGIIDPTKVVRVALENAVSVAGVLLLTEATLIEIPEPPAAASGGPSPDM